MIKIIVMVLSLNLMALPGLSEESSMLSTEESLSYYQELVGSLFLKDRLEETVVENNEIFNHQNFRATSQEAFLEEVFNEDQWMVDCIMDHTYKHYSESDGPINTARIINKCLQLRAQ